MEAGNMELSNDHFQQQMMYSPAGSAPSPDSPNGGNNGSSPKAGKKGHTRTYQACQPCRDRKVRCDMGNVENPRPPPCARCRREQRNCVFAKTRRKNGPPPSRKRDRSETIGFDNLGEAMRGPKRKQINGYHSESPHDLRVPSPLPEAIGRVDAEFKNEIHSGEDAFLSLVNAANHLAHNPTLHTSQAKAGGLSGQDLDNAPEYPQEAIRQAAKKHWSRFRYVRSGLMSAAEAMAYVDYFYTKCMPFTPITIPDYRDPALHQVLLEREPFLIMAIMTIASRFMSLNANSSTGQISRPQNIHNVLFKDTQKILTGLIYAQEQFGGGMNGGGKAKARASDPLHRYGLRSITTVEALLLMCEWAPRALHFPPEADIELMTPLNPYDDDEDLENENFVILNGDGQKRRESWLEPAWRCDTMVWMLLHNAKALALEIGLFEDRTEVELMQTANGLTEDEVHTYFVRKMKTRAIFWAFYVQTCGRLELIGKVPTNYLESLNYGVADLRVRVEVEKRAANFESGVETHKPTPMARGNNFVNNPEEANWFFWQEITAIMKSANQNMFPRKERTRELTRTGGYRKWIEIYGPMLDEWRKEFDNCTLIPEPMRTILLIEYEYVAMYIHSLPLQAFVERAIAATPSKQNLDAFVPGGVARNDSLTNLNHGGILPEDVRKWMQDDYPYVQKLVASCQHVLALIGESKIPQDQLKHFSVRVYFRIMASAVHLLKERGACDEYLLNTYGIHQSFVVGAYAENITRSFELLRKASDVLETRIVDDVHIGRTFAEMIRTVSTQIHKRLTRFQPSSGIGRSRAASATPAVSHSPAVGAISATHNFNFNVDPTSNIYSNMNGNGLLNDTNIDWLAWSNNPGAAIANIDDYDSSKTAMPPPRDFGSENAGADTGLNTPMNNGNSWITLDLHPLMSMAANGENYAVSHGHFGPTFEGGGDMLDPFMPDLAAMNPQQMHGLPMMYQNGGRINGI